MFVHVLLYINCGDLDTSHVEKVMKSDENIDIYDYLTKMHLLYIQSNIKNPEFEFLYCCLDQFLENSNLNINNLNYSKIYEVIKNGSNQNNCNYIKITTHKVLEI